MKLVCAASQIHSIFVIYWSYGCLYFQSKQQDPQDLRRAAQTFPRSGNARPQQQQHRGYKSQLIPQSAAEEPVSVTKRVFLIG